MADRFSGQHTPLKMAVKIEFSAATVTYTTITIEFIKNNYSFRNIRYHLWRGKFSGKLTTKKLQGAKRST